MVSATAEAGDSFVADSQSDVCSLVEIASVVTLKPANGGQGKTGQREGPGLLLFYPAESCGGKSVFVRQLRAGSVQPRIGWVAQTSGLCHDSATLIRTVESSARHRLRDI